MVVAYIMYIFGYYSEKFKMKKMLGDIGQLLLAKVELCPRLEAKNCL